MSVNEIYKDVKAKLKGHKQDIQEDKERADRSLKATERVIAILKQRQSVCKVETEEFFTEVSDNQTKKLIYENSISDNNSIMTFLSNEVKT